MIGEPKDLELTREEILRAAAGGAAAWALAALPGLGCSRDAEQPETRRRGHAPYFLSDSELARMSENVEDSGKPWIAAAFRRTLSLADEGVDVRPRAPSPDQDYSSVERWHSELYEPGLRQGRYVLAQSLAHAVTGRERFAESAKGFMLEWATTYTWPEEDYGPRVGHQVAEPVGFMVKAFFAYDLLRPSFSPSERRTFEDWAALFIARGMRQADHARDEPWTPTAAVTNGAAWARCLAVTAAAAAARSTLREALDWNWSHRTEGTDDEGEHFSAHGPLDYGWPWLLENAMHANGQMVEEEYRRSIDYALYTWQPLQIIADIDSHAGDARLLSYETSSGKSLQRPMDYYSTYLREEELSPYRSASDPDSDGTRTFSTAMEAHRASAEKFRNALPDSPVLADIVQTGGEAQRGRNFDPHIVGYGALLGELTGS